MVNLRRLLSSVLPFTAALNARLNPNFKITLYIPVMYVRCLPRVL